jgi:MinD-like ATPase involved in chromosome partitioning or flagellar assembly
MTILCGLSNPDDELLAAVGGRVEVVAGIAEVSDRLAADPAETLVILGPALDLAQALAFAQRQRVGTAERGVLLVRPEVDVELLTLALRAGVREVVQEGDLAALATACERSRALTLASAHPDRDAAAVRTGTVITVFSAKGGCGKTTTATNLAVALADGGARRVCLVDLDLAFGDVAISLQLAPDRTIADAIAMADDLDADAARALLTPWGKGLDCVLAPVTPGDAQRVPASLVTRLLTQLRAQYDYLVVDTPADFSEHVLAALDVSDKHLLLTTPDLPALKNLRLTLDMLDLLGYGHDGRAIVLNRAGSKVGLTEADVERVVAAPPTARMPSSRDVPASVNRGVPLVSAEPNHRFSVAVRQLAAWCARDEAPAGPDRSRWSALRVPLRARRTV